MHKQNRKLKEAQAPDREKVKTFYERMLNVFNEVPTLTEENLKAKFEDETSNIKSAIEVFLKSYETN